MAEGSRAGRPTCARRRWLCRGLVTVLCLGSMILPGIVLPADESPEPAPSPVRAAPDGDGAGPGDGARGPAADGALPAAKDDNPVPDDATLEASGARIGEITIRVGNIFDPEAEGENRKLFRLVNRLHRRTRRGVIRRLLLIEEGDVYSASQLRESERILRQTGYLYDARIRPVRYDGDMVDIVVETRDVWTLQAGVGFGRSGGENSSHFGLQDKNFLGWGKDLEFKRSSDVDRTTSLFRYRDRNLAGVRLRLDAAYSNNSDGQSHRFTLARPFYSLDARWAAGTRFVADDRVDSYYREGEITGQFRHRVDFVEVFGGVSRGLVERTANRLRAGFTYERDLFETAEGLAGPEALPPDRTLAYPWIELESTQDRFIEVHDLDHIARTEDLNLGRELHLRLGWCSTSFGSDRNRAIVDFDARAGTSPGPGQLLFVTGHAGGRFGSGRSENLVLGGGVRYYLRDWGPHVLLLAARGDLTHRLDPELQLLLGGDNGLRGYPLRYQEGDRRVLLTVEQRFYTDWHLFKLVHVGAAIFADAGRAWFHDSADAARNDFGLLRDVGLGLRLGSSRSAKASLVHVDLAMPLDGDESISRLQVLVTTKGSF